MKIRLITLAAVLIIVLSACGGTPATSNAGTDSISQQSSVEATPAPTATPTPTATATPEPSELEEDTQADAEEEQNRSTDFVDGNHEYAWFDITISIPDAWTAMKTEEEALNDHLQGFTVDQDEDSTIVSAILKLEMEEGNFAGISSEEKCNNYINSVLSKVTNGQREEFKAGSIDDHEGFMFTYTYEENGKFLWSYQALFASGNGDLYVVQFLTTADMAYYYVDDVVAITKSIVIDDSNVYVPTAGESNALRKAGSYLAFMAFSREGLIKQLEFEGFTNDEAVYAVDNCGADWYDQAVKKAKSYLELMGFSKDSLIEQLEFDGFTYEEAVYGAEQNGFE